MIFSAQKQRESQEWRTETMSESSSNSHYFQQRVPLSFDLRFPFRSQKKINREHNTADSPESLTAGETRHTISTDTDSLLDL